MQEMSYVCLPFKNHTPPPHHMIKLNSTKWNTITNSGQTLIKYKNTEINLFDGR